MSFKLKSLYITTLVFCILEFLSFSGVIYGWGALVYILKEEGYFAGECETTVNSTNTTDVNYTLRYGVREDIVTFPQCITSNGYFVQVVVWVFTWPPVQNTHWRQCIVGRPWYLLWYLGIKKISNPNTYFASFLSNLIWNSSKDLC